MFFGDSRVIIIAGSENRRTFASSKRNKDIFNRNTDIKSKVLVKVKEIGFKF